jgi:hypothetical protein
MMRVMEGDIRELMNEELTVDIASRLEIGRCKFIECLGVKIGFERFGQGGKLKY